MRDTNARHQLEVRELNLYIAEYVQRQRQEKPPVPVVYAVTTHLRGHRVAFVRVSLAAVCIGSGSSKTRLDLKAG